MSSRVKQLEEMCKSINEHGGGNDSTWTTALLTQIAYSLATIADKITEEQEHE